MMQIKYYFWIKQIDHSVPTSPMITVISPHLSLSRSSDKKHISQKNYQASHQQNTQQVNLILK